MCTGTHAVEYRYQLDFVKGEHVCKEAGIAYADKSNGARFWPPYSLLECRRLVANTDDQRQVHL